MDKTSFDDLSNSIDKVLEDIRPEDIYPQQLLDELRVNAYSFASVYLNRVEAHKALLDERKELQNTLYEVTKAKQKLEALYENLCHSYTVLSNTQEAILTHNRKLHNLVFNELRFWN